MQQTDHAGDRGAPQKAFGYPNAMLATERKRLAPQMGVSLIMKKDAKVISSSVQNSKDGNDVMFYPIERNSFPTY